MHSRAIPVLFLLVFTKLCGGQRAIKSPPLKTFKNYLSTNYCPEYTRIWQCYRRCFANNKAYKFIFITNATSWFCYSTDAFTKIAMSAAFFGKVYNHTQHPMPIVFLPRVKYFGRTQQIVLNSPQSNQSRIHRPMHHCRGDV